MLVEAASEGAERPVADNGDSRNSSKEEHLRISGQLMTCKGTE